MLKTFHSDGSILNIRDMVLPGLVSYVVWVNNYYFNTIFTVVAVRLRHSMFLGVELRASHHLEVF